MHLRDVCSVLPTPFRGGGDVDHLSLTRVVDLVVNAGVGAVSALAPMAEASRLSDRERLGVVETVTSAANGRVRVIVGTSADGVRTCIELSREARRLGAFAVMIGPPRATRVSSEAVVNHYKAIAEAVDLPIVVHDYPPACGFAMESGLLARIAREVPAARTIALEDPPTPFKITRLLKAAGETRVDVLGGLGGAFLLEELFAGACGVMSACAYPEALVRIVTLFRSGRVDEAADLFYTVVPLIRFESQESIGVAVRKEILRRRGVLADASTRAPGAVLDEGTRQMLDRMLAWTKQREGTEWISG
jgi:4-hydroxy-tetrahydrodipicolinate synthase